MSVTIQYTYTLPSIICIVNVHTDVEYYKFDENDEIQYLDEQQEDSVSLSDMTPSYYLRHQQSGGIIYANRNLNEEAKL